MAGRSRQSHDKRQREKRKAEKAAMKRARRQNKDVGPQTTTDTDEPEPDKDALMERFRVLNEKHAAGEISTEEFEQENNEILMALGVEVE